MCTRGYEKRMVLAKLHFGAVAGFVDRSDDRNVCSELPDVGFNPAKVWGHWISATEDFVHMGRMQAVQEQLRICFQLLGAALLDPVKKGFEEEAAGAAGVFVCPDQRLDTSAAKDGFLSRLRLRHENVGEWPA